MHMKHCLENSASVRHVEGKLTAMPGLMVWLMFSTALPTPLPRYLQVHMLVSALACLLCSGNIS